MPKRPCAILVTPDNQTILCGDKFGDVYSLPLVPTEMVELDKQVAVPSDSVRKAYAPSATNLTVHTARNRRALEEQLKRKDSDAKGKEPLKFEHSLLLGHVSLLTDMLHVTQKVDGKSRQHIMTSDRDEHIRVSRGPPQAHVIERYCLGHTEFISKLCPVPGTNVLLSAGGDTWMGVWDWTTGKLLARRDLKAALDNHPRANDWRSPDTEDFKVAVSGIWIAPAVYDSNKSTQVAVVSIEGIPVPVVYSIGSIEDSTSSPMFLSENKGRVLDIASLDQLTVLSFDATEVRCNE